MQTTIFNDILFVGRSLQEYVDMFALSAADLQRPILSVASGGSSLGAELRSSNPAVTSLDPLYSQPPAAVEQLITQQLQRLEDAIDEGSPEWVWSYHRSKQDLLTSRTKTLHAFLNDYRLHHGNDNYITDALPFVSTERKYGLCLCSHFLFLYGNLLDYDFHIASVQRLLEIANEIRIYPIMTQELVQYPHLNTLRDELQQKGIRSYTVPVPYRLRKDSNHMLVIRH